jgi:hypothetical protein
MARSQASARALRDFRYRYEKQLDGSTCINTYYAVFDPQPPCGIHMINAREA